MAAVKLKCYEVTKDSIGKMVFDKFAHYPGLPNNIATAKDKYKVWLGYKDAIIKKDTLVKTYKGVHYIPIKVSNPNALIVLALGDDAEALLKEIFVQETGNKVAQVTPVQAPVETKVKPNVTKVIDLADNTIAIDNKLKAIDNASQVQIKGKLNEKESYAYLHHIIGENVIKEFKASSDNAEKFFVAFATALKANKANVDKYTNFTSDYVANMLKSAHKENKSDKNFYSNVISQ